MPDYRSARHTVEVKELGSTRYEAFRRAFRKTPGVYPMPTLTKTWMISPNTTAASFAIKEEVATPFLPALSRRLAPLLRELEDRGISDYRRLVSIALAERFTGRFAGSGESALTLAGRISDILGADPICEAADMEGVPPGIALAHHQEMYRPFDLNVTVRDAIQNWIDYSSENMCASMRREGSLQIRCGVVVAPDYGFGRTIDWSLSKDFPNLREVPSGALKLPDELDVLTVIAGDQVISFRKASGEWDRTQLTAIP
ncbi:hypothetical protein GS909_23285 [Rhodococcus hoagii]|nr:hypothetical protein [Prescottella equi]